MAKQAQVSHEDVLEILKHKVKLSDKESELWNEFLTTIKSDKEAALLNESEFTKKVNAMDSDLWSKFLLCGAWIKLNYHKEHSKAAVEGERKES